LQPRAIGKFTIGNAAITIKGQTLKSAPLTIEVVKGSNNQQAKKESNKQEVSTKEIGENVFIRAIVDKSSVYQGEQVTVTYKLYTRLNIQSPQISKLPSYQGFWSEEIETSNQISFSRENYDGKLFNVATLKKAALFPTQTGELSVTPFELKIPVLIQRKQKSNSPFDDFFSDPFFGRTESVEYTAKSNTVKVNVLPLPQTSLSSFNGAVGNYTLQTSIDKKNVKQNEPITLKVMLSGEGNINLLDLPQFQIPNGFEKYDPKISTDVSRSGVINGKKNFELLVIPRVSGSFEIPGLQFSFFNPKKKSYVTVSATAYPIIVEQGSAEYSGGGNGLSKEEIKLLGQDIRFIKTIFSD
ncbi:MAG: BatD family protein, partial [Ignavibacteria bacterium]|nr:BatD family protein [Ignavibacteria bacterium]